MPFAVLSNLHSLLTYVGDCEHWWRHDDAVADALCFVLSFRLLLVFMNSVRFVVFTQKKRSTTATHVVSDERDRVT